MLFSLKLIRKNKKFFYNQTMNFPLNHFPSISEFWLKKTSYMINNGKYIYCKKSGGTYKSLCHFKNFIIEVSFVIMLKLLRINKNNVQNHQKFNESLRFFFALVSILTKI